MLSEAKSHTKIILEDQRKHILSDAQFELLLQERRAERANSSVQFLSDQLRSQCSEGKLLSLRDMNKSNFFVQKYRVEEE